MSRRYYTVPPRSRGLPRCLNDLVLDYVGGLRLLLLPARRRRRSPWQGLTRLEGVIPAPFRGLRLPVGVQWLGTGLPQREEGGRYAVVYRLPPGHSPAHQAALETALERQVLDRQPSRWPQWTVRGQPEQVAWLEPGEGWVRVWLVHDPASVCHVGPPDFVLTPPPGQVWLPDFHGYHALPAPQLSAAECLSHWQAEAGAQGWQMSRLEADWGGLLHCQRGEDVLEVTLSRTEGGWLVGLRTEPERALQLDGMREARLYADLVRDLP